MKQRIKIYFTNEQSLFRVTRKLRKLLRQAITETLAYEGFCNDCAVSVSFTDNEGIRELNRMHRGIDRATDVLSFPMFSFEDDSEEIEGALGDIVISLERAREQAETFGHSFEREVAFLCVHSMLHLLGYDHELGEEQDLDMRRRQSEIVARLGLGIAGEK